MKLSALKLAKLARQTFLEQGNPLSYDKVIFLPRFISYIRSLDNVDADKTKSVEIYPGPRQDYSVIAYIKLKTEHFYFSFIIYAHWDNVVGTYFNGDFQPIYSFEQVKAFIDACFDKLNRKFLLKQKKEKANKFKYQAILAQLKKCSKKHEVNFAAECNSILVKIYLEITENQWFIIKIPFKGYQEILDKLDMTFESIAHVRNHVRNYAMPFVCIKYRPQNAEHYQFNDLS